MGRWSWRGALSSASGEAGVQRPLRGQGRASVASCAAASPRGAAKTPPISCRFWRQPPPPAPAAGTGLSERRCWCSGAGGCSAPLEERGRLGQGHRQRGRFWSHSGQTARAVLRTDPGGHSQATDGGAARSATEGPTPARPLGPSDNSVNPVSPPVDEQGIPSSSCLSTSITSRNGRSLVSCKN